MEVSVYDISVAQIRNLATAIEEWHGRFAEMADNHDPLWPYISHDTYNLMALAALSVLRAVKESQDDPENKAG